MDLALNNKKIKILLISDIPTASSGVANQARILCEGLLKTGKFSFKCLGAAVKHKSYRPFSVKAPNNEWHESDFVVKPIDGFGNKELIRKVILQEKPDILLIFTDPRFFQHIFEMEDEIHAAGVKIAYNHLWDSDPWPDFNEPMYDCIDAINCISKHTYDMCAKRYPEKTKFLPHAVKTTDFYPLTPEQKKSTRLNLLGSNYKDKFIGLWVNRNARRKRPGDLLVGWKNFMEKLQNKHGHQDAVLIMHTNPHDQEGPNLVKVINHLGLTESVKFSTSMLQTAQMNALHNCADFYINVSHSEGFGLGSLESMMAGNPIVVTDTGGMTYQAKNLDGSINGVLMKPDLRCLVGSQSIPYLYEDFVSHETIANSIMQVYDMGKEKRELVGSRACMEANSRFSYEKLIQGWTDSLIELSNKKMEKIYRVETI